MADPLSIASGIGGLIALAASTAQGLTTLITDIRNAPAEIEDLKQDLQALDTVIKTTANLYQVYGLKVEDAALSETFSGILEGCVRPMQNLEKVLQRFSGSDSKSGRRSPMVMMLWTMRKGEIRGLRDRLRDGKASLTLAVDVFNG